MAVTAPLLRAAPEEAVILAGFDLPGFGLAGPAAGDDRAAVVRALERLICDCGRYGFAKAHVLHPSGWAERVAEALGTLPSVSPRPMVVARAASTPLAGLTVIAEGRTDRLMVLFGPAPVEANWLAILDHQGPSEAGAFGLLPCPDTGRGLAFGLAGGLALPAGADGAAPGLCSLAVLDCTALRAAAGSGDLGAFLTHLAAAHRLGGWAMHPATGPRASAILPLRPERPALFLDRDGTLNVDFGYVSDPERIVLLPGAAQAVRRANDLGFYVFLVTNQSGVGRGYYREEDVHACNAALQRLLRAEGAHLDDIRYAIDHPDAAVRRGDGGWRKPEPGMLVDLMAHWPVDRARSLMVGDKTSDVDAGRAAGIAAVKVAGGDLDAVLRPLLEARAPGVLQAEQAEGSPNGEGAEGEAANGEAANGDMAPQFGR